MPLDCKTINNPATSMREGGILRRKWQGIVLQMSGNITIIPPKENFLKVSKGIIYNGAVDALSLGVYVKVIALGRQWNLNIKGLSKTLQLSEDKIRSCFAVLEKAGYLRRTKTHGAHGHFSGWDYEVSSEPFTDIAKTPTSVNTDIGDNRHRLNDTLNRDIIEEDRDIEEGDREKKKKADFVPPTIEAIRSYAISIGFLSLDAEHFYDYYESANWRKPNGAKMTNWKQFVVTWKNNAKKRGEDITIPFKPQSIQKPANDRRITFD